MKRAREIDPTMAAKAGLQLTAAALMDGYPKAVKDGRTDEWQKAVLAVAEWYAHIDQHGIDGRKKQAAPFNQPFERVPQHGADPGFGPVPPEPDSKVVSIHCNTPEDADDA